MTGSVRLISRIALFAALFYVLSWGTAFLPNVNLGFLVAFTAGLLWGAVPGMLVGAVGMGIFTMFNPYGPATVPVGRGADCRHDRVRAAWSAVSTGDTTPAGEWSRCGDMVLAARGRCRVRCCLFPAGVADSTPGSISRSGRD